MLREFELAVLQACCREMHLSKARHVPEHVVIKRFPGAEREARKALKKLVAKGYVGHHPTRGDDIPAHGYGLEGMYGNDAVM